MATATLERETLSRIVRDLPDDKVTSVIDFIENHLLDEDDGSLTEDEERALIAYEDDKQNGNLITFSIEDIRRRLKIDS